MSDEFGMYDRIEVIMHVQKDEDDGCIVMEDDMLDDVGSDSFEWWSDHIGNLHIQLWTSDDVIDCANILKSMAERGKMIERNETHMQ